MRFPLWLRPLTVRPNRATRRALHRPVFRPRVEALEDRSVPATVNWTNPAGGDWDTGSNWSNGVGPGATDDVVIDLPNQNGFTVTHTSSTAFSVNSLKINGDTLDTSANLHISGNLTNNGSLLGKSGTQLSFGAVTTTPTSSIQGYDVIFGGAAALSGSFSATDSIQVSGQVSFSGCTVDIAGDRLDIEGGTLDLTGASLVDASGATVGTANTPLGVDAVKVAAAGTFQTGGAWITIGGPDGFGWVPSGPYAGPYTFLWVYGTIGGGGTVTLAPAPRR